MWGKGQRRGINKGENIVFISESWYFYVHTLVDVLAYSMSSISTSYNLGVHIPIISPFHTLLSHDFRDVLDESESSGSLGAQLTT
jgi:hypothetical protein